MIKFITFLLLLTTSNARLIGGDPKTWSPTSSEENYTIVIPFPLTSELDCTTCKILVATLETDACLKCPNSKCLDFFQAYGDPTQICQQINICPKKKWWSFKD